MANRLFRSGGQSEEEPGVICCVPLAVSRKVPVTGKCLQLPVGPTPVSGQFPHAANRQAGRLGELKNEPPLPGQPEVSPESRRCPTMTLGLPPVLTPLAWVHKFKA